MDKCAHVDICFNVEIQRERERDRGRLDKQRKRLKMLEILRQLYLQGILEHFFWKWRRKIFFKNSGF